MVVLIFEGAVAKARNELAVHENGMKQDFILAYDRAVDLRDGRDIPEWKKRGRERFARLVKAEAKSSLVDIGCGTGIHAVYFREEGIDVRCIDLSPGNVERRRAKGLKEYQCDVPELKSLGLTFDPGFAMNSLVHVPRGQLQEALNAIRDTLKPTGLFYWGQYGGEIRERVYEGDTYEPKRFFSLLDDEGIQQEAAKRFELLEFDAMVTRPDDHLRYQSLILRAKHG